MKTIIIGCGISGLAAAIRMAAKGHQVEVFECAEGPGGKMTQFYSNGYRFDAGPSLFTMPQYIEELFELANKNTGDYFRYKPLDVICDYFWADGTHLKAYADIDQLEQEVANKLEIPVGTLKKYLNRNRKKYELTGKIFLEKSLHKVSTWLSKDVLKALVHLHQFDIFSTMHEVNKKEVKDPKMIQFYDRFATYNGSNPYMASGILTMISYLEQGFGAYIPEKGMYHITDSFFNLAKSLGVKFHFNTYVDKICIERGKATGIEVHQSFMQADYVICNMDVFLAYDRLLTGYQKPTKILEQERSSSALIFYWGVEKSFDQLSLHNIFFSNDYKSEFQALQDGKIDNDPTVYINITSKELPLDAPANCENWFTLINTPFDSGQNWDEILPHCRELIIQKLTSMLGASFQNKIVTESILEPRTLASKTLSHKGALYGTASNNRLAAFLRHPNFSMRYKNLYFCGGSAHPGGGIPLCLLSAKIVDELIHN